MLDQTGQALKEFGITERMFFALLCVFLIVGFIGILGSINSNILIEVPSRSGTFTEGVIGTPRYINPLLAVSDADQDLSALIYSGLLKASETSELVEDLAESFTISDDKLSYTFKIRDDAVFHDEFPVSADDVLFTIQKAQDNILRSPKRANWEGVKLEKIDTKTIRFTLEQPYTPFLENATLGILPKHIWGETTSNQFLFSQFNIEPIGSGPYLLDAIVTNRSGVPQTYKLKPFKSYVHGEPYIFVNIKFFANELELINAFKNNSVNSIGTVSPTYANELVNDERVSILKTTLPRIFAVFFNQNQAVVLTNKEVREALRMSIDKQEIINAVLNGYGVALDGPIPSHSLSPKPHVAPALLNNESDSATIATGTSSAEQITDASENSVGDSIVVSSNTEKAREHLEKNGWKINQETGIYEKTTKKGTMILAFSLSTSDTPELKKAGQIIKKTWEELGASIDLKIFASGDLNQNVIRPRKYDSLLFGEVVGRDLDLFAFWHSSQRSDPGLNIALYTNIVTDNILEKARQSSLREEQLELQKAFVKEIKNDAPAIFLYSPEFVYFVPNELRGKKPIFLSTPSERFTDIQNWFLYTERVWNFFD